MRIASRALFALGTVLLVAGLLAGVVNRQVLDGSQFAKHVDAIRADGDVSRQVGLLISDRVLDAQPDLVALRPLLETVSASVVSTPALGPVVRSAVAPLHRSLVSGDGAQIVLTLADVGAVLVAAITTLVPDSQAVIPSDLDVQLANLGAHQTSSDLIELAHLVGLLAWLLPLLGLGCLVASAWPRRRSDLRRVGRRVGWGLLSAGGVVGVLVVVTRFVMSQVDTQSLGGSLAVASWAELSGSVWRTAGGTAAVGLVVMIVSTVGLDFDARTMLQRARGLLSDAPATPRTHLVRGAWALGLGALLVLRPLDVLTAGVVVIGFVFVLVALRHVVVALGAVARQRSVPPAVQRLARPLAVGLCVVVVLGTVAVGALPGDDKLTAVAASTDPDACNGHVELCDRRFDDVAFPGTHNSMSAADQPGWFLAEQPKGVLGQLDDGIRVFLIDSWYGQRSQRAGIIANTEESRAAALAEAEDTYGPEVLASALRVRDALDLTPTGPAKPYLCHALCELGSTDWEPLMAEVKTWLDEHPREVVTFFVQDEVSPADAAALVATAGLLPYIHTQQSGEPWPTLGAMISSGKRVVFLHEHEGGGTQIPWILDGETWVQDTPFAFRRKADFSCAAFRGTAASPLFLVNHWLSNPASRVSDAAKVNAEGVLLPRLEKCRDERGMIPNFVAVDNYDRGDLLAAVDALNGF